MGKTGWLASPAGAGGFGGRQQGLGQLPVEAEQVFEAAELGGEAGRAVAEALQRGQQAGHVGE